MPKRKERETVVRYIPVEYATEEEAAAAQARAEKALDDIVRFLARSAAEQDYKELMETGESRWLSSDPNVDWAAHDAKWAAKDAAEASRLEQVRAEEKSLKREARRRRRMEVAQPPVTENTPAARDEMPADMAQLPLDRRLAIADEIAAKHPGSPVSAMLLKLFPELVGQKEDL